MARSRARKERDKVLKIMYAPGFRANGVPPEVAAAELEQVRKRDGDLRAPAVVDHARPEDSPLHPIFEWQDDVAGERYREHQARNLIRAVVAVPAGPDPTPLRRYTFVPASSTEGQSGYQPTEMVARTVDEFDRALHALAARADSLAASYAELRRVHGTDQGDRAMALSLIRDGQRLIAQGITLLRAMADPHQPPPLDDDADDGAQTAVS